MDTIGSRLAREKGFGPGFDFLRITLALGVVSSHSFQFVHNELQTSNVWWFTVYSIVPMFFALSGFLVTGSAQRLSLKDFIINRTARIVPALLVEVTLSSLILGPIVSSSKLYEYFSDIQTYQYFFNVFGFMHYELPGVFINNPMPRIVNSSIWTIPHEIGCYIVISLLLYFGLLRSKLNTTVTCITILILSTAVTLVINHLGLLLPKIDWLISYLSSQLIAYFLFGLISYVYRFNIPYSPKLFVLCLASYVFISMFGSPNWNYHLLFRILINPILMYIVLFIGMSKIKPIPVYSKGDYSYGVYLYGAPIQQTLLHFFPNLTNFILLDAISVVVTTAFAIFSWHIVEKPALKLRRNFSTSMRDVSQKPLGIPISKSASEPSSVDVTPQ